MTYDLKKHFWNRIIGMVGLMSIMLILLSTGCSGQDAAEKERIIITPDVDFLIAGLHDADPSYRAWAAAKLGEFMDASSVGPLIQVLQNDNEPYVQSSAADALAKIGDAAVDPLIEVLKTGNYIR